ncbi:hypothetical protein [Lysobacter gummosus]|uniref:hypothetical protein n=1 Tax=Lysobacter gummosus TaxID=262324 RepID=UPI00362C781B
MPSMRGEAGSRRKYAISNTRQRAGAIAAFSLLSRPSSHNSGNPPNSQTAAFACEPADSIARPRR